MYDSKRLGWPIDGEYAVLIEIAQVHRRARLEPCPFERQDMRDYAESLKQRLQAIKGKPNDYSDLSKQSYCKSLSAVI